MTVDEIKALVIAERARQDRLHPADWKTWAPSAIFCVLAEEVGEVAKAVNDRSANGVKQELVEVAAVCVRWLEAMDRLSVVWLEWHPLPSASPTERVRLLHKEVAPLAHDGWQTEGTLMSIVVYCVRWLLSFEDDPTQDVEKKRIQDRKPSEA